MYGGCSSPDCVDLDRLRNKQMETLREGGGTQIGPKKWWYPSHSANYSVRDRTKNDIDHIVIHTAEGYTGGLDTFRDPAREASAHYAMGWDGTEVLMVREKDKAWHASSSNDRSIGIEHVGFAHAMYPGTETEWSKAMLKASAKLVAKLARKYDIPINKETIISHASVDPSRRSDPGPYWPWDWYIKKAKWYYYRPYVFAGLGVLALGGLWYAAREREARRIRGWKKV